MKTRRLAKVIPLVTTASVHHQNARGAPAEHLPAQESARHLARVAQNLEQVLAAWRFVHDCHADQGLVAENQFRLHATKQAAEPGALVLCSTVGGRLASTLTLTRDGSDGLALDAPFGRELDRLRKTGQRLSEVGLVAHRSSNSGLDRLLSISIDYGLRDDFSGIVIGVHPRHAGFYTRSFGFVPIGGNGNPASLGKRALALLHLDRSVLAASSAPREIRRLRENPVPADFYAGAFGFLTRQLAGTVLSEYLAGLDQRSERAAVAR